MRLPTSYRSVVTVLAAAGLAGLSLAAVPATAAPGELADSGGISVRNGAGMSIASVRSDAAAGGIRDARPTGGGIKTNGISYHGGPVMTQPTTNVYYVWYGNWGSSDTTPTILTDFAGNVGGSPYFNINTTYDASGTKVKNSVTYIKSTTDSSRGTSLSDSDITGIVSDALTSGRLPVDANGVYFVLTAAGVKETSGFLTKYCGWHTYGTLNGTPIKYSFVGNPGGSSACLQQTGGSPNGNINADGMASVIAHELEEAVTDPQLNAWYDNRGYENADKCAWTFGATYSSGGGLANMHLGSRDYLIQRNWVNAAGGYCALSY
jgi:hypothetical protein